MEMLEVQSIEMVLVLILEQAALGLRLLSTSGRTVTKKIGVK
jgi:hypothetical protein